MHPTQSPFRIPIHDSARAGIPILDDDFDPSEQLLPEIVERMDESEFFYE